MDEAGIKEKMRLVHWVPLESNPEMLTSFARKVGLPENAEFVDVFGTDPELLGMVEGQCLAVTLLFACSEASSQAKKEQKEAIEKDGQKLHPDLKYLKQYVGNACGTIACIHSLANNLEVLGIPADSPIGEFVKATEGMTPHEAGAKLAEATQLHEASEESAAGGQTEAPEATARTDAHFIAFVQKDGDVYELDGGKAFPINHGPADEGLLAAAAQAIKKNFMEKDPDSIHFNMMALVKQTEDQ
jgi:ubiquitin carboxyl-terminal hydrolase L3